jgi:hypothetical membrane protein
MEKTARLRGRVFLLAMAGCVQFLLLSTVAMFFYPGGTYSDEGTTGYVFTQNFFSDLGRTAAHNGDSNTVSMVLFIVALSLAGLSLITFFLAVPPHFAENRTAKRLSIIGSVVGVISGIGFIGIAAVPADVNQTLHTDFVYVAFTGFLFVVFCYSTAILKSRTYPRAYAYAYFAFAIILALYLVILFSGPEIETTGGLTIQAVGQKVVVYTGIICVVIQSWGAYRVERRRSQEIPGSAHSMK